MDLNLLHILYNVLAPALLPARPQLPVIDTSIVALARHLDLDQLIWLLRSLHHKNVKTSWVQRVFPTTILVARYVFHLFHWKDCGSHAKLCVVKLNVRVHFQAVVCSLSIVTILKIRKPRHLGCIDLWVSRFGSASISLPGARIQPNGTVITCLQTSTWFLAFSVLSKLSLVT
jgi:hypothetical protein